MNFLQTRVSDAVTQLRASGSEEDLETAAQLEKELEEQQGDGEGDEPEVEAQAPGTLTAEDEKRLSRPELNERATAAGVKNPEDLDNKAAVADAIRRAEAG